MPVCKLCNLNFSMITWSHLKSAHNMTLSEYYLQYPEADISEPYLVEIKIVAAQNNWTPSKKEEARQTSNRVWARPGQHEKHSKIMSEVMNRPEVILQESQSAYESLEDPIVIRNREEGQNRRYEDPEQRELRSRVSLEFWASLTPEEKEELLSRSIHSPEVHALLRSRDTRGENSPSWKGGHNSGLRYGWEAMRESIFIRDDYTCQRCYSTKGIVCHHMDHDRLHEDDSNLITLCKPCHDEEPSHPEWLDLFRTILSSKYGYTYEKEEGE